MAEVSALKALHYALSEPAALGDVAAPPYDVIDEAGRAELIARSPHNVVELDLPVDPAGGDPYEHAAAMLRSWKADGVLEQDEAPALWALSQDYTAPDGSRMTRRGFLCAVGLAEYGDGIRAHERTQPGPKEDRLRLTRATRHNMSPIFALAPGDAWKHLGPAVEGKAPWGETTDADGTTHTVWRVDDPAVHEAVAAELADGEMLIADGHHRYETALAYQREAGPEPGGHDRVLMALVSLADPGLTVFATHRLLKDLSEEQRLAIRDLAKEKFEIEEVGEDEIVPPADAGPAAFGYMDAHHLQPMHLRLKDTATLDEALSGSKASRRLDAGALEALFLKGSVGLSSDDIAAKRQLAYKSNTADAIAMLRDGSADACFFLRPTPVDQVREIAAAGETMPPKSTYFFPKLLTGIVFNPLD